MTMMYSWLDYRFRYFLFSYGLLVFIYLSVCISSCRVYSIVYKCVQHEKWHKYRIYYSIFYSAYVPAQECEPWFETWIIAMFQLDRVCIFTIFQGGFFKWPNSKSLFTHFEHSHFSLLFGLDIYYSNVHVGTME